MPCISMLTNLDLQVYITGHGGDGFMKFQDKEEVTSDEIGQAFALVIS